jgi:hypothetical protein|tara:strand:+ start:2684 stop:2836 length:153 start_codon:yes stop_codon:yes gene_type:complete
MKTVTLSKKEIELINESCEYFMQILKDDSTFENPNNKKFYDLWDIRNKIK